MPGPGGAPYVTPAQLLNYLPAATLALASSAQQLQACTDATNEADGFANGRYTMPLLDWPTDWTTHVAYIAIHNLMNGPVGFAPQAGSDSNIDTNYARAVGGNVNGAHVTGYFPDVQATRRHPAVTPSIPVGQDAVHDAPQVSSDQPRGWAQFSRSGRPVVGGF